MMRMCAYVCTYVHVRDHRGIGSILLYVHLMQKLTVYKIVIIMKFNILIMIIIITNNPS
jgi:hypothetical protein